MKPLTVIVTNEVAALHYRAGDYEAASILFGQVVEGFSASLGPNSIHLAGPLSLQGRAHLAFNQPTDAEKALQRALGILRAQRQLDRNGKNYLATTLSGLASVRAGRQDWENAEAYLREALRLQAEVMDPNSFEIADTLASLGDVLGRRGRVGEAESVLNRALGISARHRGRDAMDRRAEILRGLAVVRGDKGNLPQAISAAEQSLKILRDVYPKGHLRTAIVQTTLASLHRRNGKLEPAETLYRHALAQFDRVGRGDSPYVASALHNLSIVLFDGGRDAEAIEAITQAIALQSRLYGRDHPGSAASYDQAAAYMVAAGRASEAFSLLDRGHALYRVAYGPTDPRIGLNRGTAAALYQSVGRTDDALVASREAVRVFSALSRTGNGAAIQRTGKADHGAYYRFHLGLLKDSGIAGTPAGAAEALATIQHARASDTAAAVAGMARRLARGNTANATLMRQAQDTEERIAALEARLLATAMAEPDSPRANAASTLAAERDRLATQLREVSARIIQQDPRAAMARNPAPVTLEDLRGLLRDDEVVVAFSIGRELGAVVAVDKRGTAMGAVPVARLEEDLRRLRNTLDPTLVTDEAGLLRFPVDLAHDLYQRLFGPVTSLLERARHVVLVPDGPLESLPLGVLLTRPATGPLRDIGGLLDLAWLGKAKALSVQPSLAAFQALRAVARPVRARKPFLGVGDPLLANHPGIAGAATRGGGASALSWLSRGITPAASLPGAVGGAQGLANVSALRRLSSLPDTADELSAIAGALGAGPESLWLRDGAVEARLKSARDLADHRVLAFATHGLVAGELDGAAEPALVLTPPGQASAEDDGLLTASEVATLTLDAEWVLLSACNTAAPDGQLGADGFSGLTRAFLYAGARSLFVSHWPVISSATVSLTTTMMRAYAEDPSRGKAEAHRRAIAAMIETHEDPYMAHPLFWAPFVIVGEAGREGSP